MRLVDLDPRWLLKDGERVGFIFRCPTRPASWQACVVRRLFRSVQWALFCDALGDDVAIANHDIQGCLEGTHSTIDGGITGADFSTLSVAAPIGTVGGGNWRGRITNGEIVGGL